MTLIIVAITIALIVTNAPLWASITAILCAIWSLALDTRALRKESQAA